MRCALAQSARTSWAAERGGETALTRSRPRGVTPVSSVYLPGFAGARSASKRSKLDLPMPLARPSRLAKINDPIDVLPYIVNTIAYDRVKARWSNWGIWDHNWGTLPGMSWKHERLLGELLREELGKYEHIPHVYASDVTPQYLGKGEEAPDQPVWAAHRAPQPVFFGGSPEYEHVQDIDAASSTLRARGGTRARQASSEAMPGPVCPGRVSRVRTKKRARARRRLAAPAVLESSSIQEPLSGSEATSPAPVSGSSVPLRRIRRVHREGRQKGSVAAICEAASVASPTSMEPK